MNGPFLPLMRNALSCYKIYYGTTEQSLQTCLCSYVVANVVIIIKNSGESFMVHRSCLIYPWIAKLNPLIQSQTWSALLICFPTPGQSIYLKNQSTGNFLFKARITNATLVSTFQLEWKTINIHCLSNFENECNRDNIWVWIFKVDFKTFVDFCLGWMVLFTHGRLPVCIKDSVQCQSGGGILQMQTLDSIYGRL